MTLGGALKKKEIWFGLFLFNSENYRLLMVKISWSRQVKVCSLIERRSLSSVVGKTLISNLFHHAMTHYDEEKNREVQRLPQDHGCVYRIAATQHG